MPSFDIVSEVDMQEVDNTVNSVMREVKQRYDFKGSSSEVTREGEEVTILADDDMQHRALVEMLKAQATRRHIDPRAFEFAVKEAASGGAVRQKVSVKQGLSQDVAKKITKEIKAQKMKVQAAIRGAEVRVTGKKRDDLQQCITMIKEMDMEQPLQFINFRD